MKRKLFTAALIASFISLASCGSVDTPASTEETLSSAKTSDSISESVNSETESDIQNEIPDTSSNDTDNFESKADSSESNTEINSSAEENSSSENSESQAKPKVIEHNSHMSEEPTSETSLAIDEGGCKNPDEPPHIHYLNDEVDINIVKGIIITTASELDEVELPYGSEYKGGVHPQFEFEADGVSYSVYVNPAPSANIEINDKYYWLDKATFEALSELVYW